MQSAPALLADDVRGVPGPPFKGTRYYGLPSSAPGRTCFDHTNKSVIMGLRRPQCTGSRHFGMSSTLQDTLMNPHKLCQEKPHTDPYHMTHNTTEREKKFAIPEKRELEAAVDPFNSSLTSVSPVPPVCWISPSALSPESSATIVVIAVWGQRLRMREAKTSNEFSNITVSSSSNDIQPPATDAVRMSQDHKTVFGIAAKGWSVV